MKASVIKPPTLPQWLEDLADHLLNSTLLINNLNQDEMEDASNSSGLKDSSTFANSARCLMLYRLLFRRLCWALFVSLASVLSCREPIIVSTLWPFTYKRPISANRSGSGPQRNPTACRLPPLPVSVPFSACHVLFGYVCMTIYYCLCDNSFLVAQKSSTRAEWVRGRCHQSTLPRLFFVPTAGGYPYRQDLIMVPSNCECLVTVGDGRHNDDDDNDADEWNKPGPTTSNDTATTL